MNKLYLEEIRFLLMVPDWNRVGEVVKRVMEERERKGIYEEEDIGFLKKLEMFARKKRRVRIADQVR